MQPRLLIIILPRVAYVHDGVHTITIGVFLQYSFSEGFVAGSPDDCLRLVGVDLVNFIVGDYREA